MTNGFKRLLVSVVVVVLTFGGCTKKREGDDEGGETSSPAVVAVRTVSIAKGNIDVVVTATGKTDALRKEKIFSPIAGRVLSSKLLEGTSVKVGDLLAIIQSKESYAAVAGAEALLKSAKSPEQVDEAERTLALAQSTQNTVTVRAKFDGIVSSRNVSEGELVAENAELLTLLDLSTIVFTADLMLRDLPTLHGGQSATVEFQSLPGQVFKARVDAINPQTDMQSQTVKVRLRFTELPSRARMFLKTDMAGTVQVVTETHRQVLIVPRSALLRNDETNTFSVVIVTVDSLAKTIAVTIGASTDSTLEVASSELHNGMKVITEGSYALTDSTKVTVMH